jgi:hypothetical protein
MNRHAFAAQHIRTPSLGDSTEHRAFVLLGSQARHPCGAMFPAMAAWPERTKPLLGQSPARPVTLESTLVKWRRVPTSTVKTAPRTPSPPRAARMWPTALAMSVTPGHPRLAPSALLQRTRISPARPHAWAVLTMPILCQAVLTCSTARATRGMMEWMAPSAPLALDPPTLSGRVRALRALTT